MTFRLRDAQLDAFRRQHNARNLCAVLERKGNRAAFDEATGMLQFADPVGRTTRYQLGQNGLLEAVTTHLGRTARLRCDDQGRLTHLLEPSGRRTELSYDEQGAAKRFARDGMELARFSWNAERTEMRADFWDSTQTRVSYTPDGRPLKLTNRLNQSDRYGYDEAGRLSELSDARGQTTRFSYDEDGRPSTTTYADGRIESVDYDPTGRVVANLNGQKVFEREVDDADRPLSYRYADGSEYSFSYDDQGRPLSAVGPHGTSTFVYDEAGRPLSETNDDQTFRFAYDASGELTSIEYPDGTRASFAYDPDKRLSQVAWAGASIAFGYDTQDLRRSITTPRLYTDVQLDRAGKPARVTVYDQYSRAVWFDTQYQYDAQSRLVARTDQESGTEWYAYDAESQLLGVANAQGQWQETFGYDGAGNRTHANGQIVVLDPGNRVRAQGDWICSHDERGNLVGISAHGTECRFVYDLKNQMTEAHGPFGVLTFKYDALGRRIEKKSADRTIRYVWCGEFLAREIITTAGGESVREYLCRPGTFEPLAVRIDGRVYYYHNDHQGTPQRLTDDRGRVVWAATYSAFGLARIQVAEIENPLRFLGQYADLETGLHYNRFRYYSPVLGRYLSPDPLGLFGGQNLYRYGKNNPKNETDPLGLLAPLAIVGIIAAAVPILAAIGVGIAEVASIDKFCWPCFWEGAKEAAPGAFLAGLAFGVAVGVSSVLCPPLAIGLLVGGALYGTFAVLDEYFGWTSGHPFSEKSDEEKSRAVGGLVGGTLAGIAGGLLGGIGGRGLGRGIQALRARGGAPMVPGPPRAAGEAEPQPIHRENIGKNLPPEEAARIMNERTRATAEQEAARNAERTRTREALDADQKADKAAIEEANRDAVEKGKRVGELKKDPNATPEQIEEATRAAKESQSNAKALQDDYRVRQEARDATAAELGSSTAGKVVEPVYDPETGEMVITESGPEGASPQIARPAESLSETTEPGKCALPRGAGVLADEAAQQGRPRPNLQTTDGGYKIKNGEVEPICACANCRAIKAHPGNQIETVPEPPEVYPVLPSAGETSPEQEDD